MLRTAVVGITAVQVGRGPLAGVGSRVARPLIPLAVEGVEREVPGLVIGKSESCSVLHIRHVRDESELGAVVCDEPAQIIAVLQFVVRIAVPSVSHVIVGESLLGKPLAGVHRIVEVRTQIGHVRMSDTVLSLGVPGTLRIGTRRECLIRRAVRRLVSIRGEYSSTPFALLEGADSFDCSGLTSQAWLAAGVAIPHTSEMQWARLKHVPIDDMRPGDLSIHCSDACHVAIYIGGGDIISAPRPGRVVYVSPAASMQILGVVRPDA